MAIGPGDVATASLFLMMLAMGMGLRAEDFLRVFRQPVAFAVGGIGQILLLPAVAFALARGLDLPAPQAVGLMLIAACPGGATSNAFSRFARGDVALSVSLTAFSSALSFATVPLVVGLGVRAFAGADAGLELPFGETALGLFTQTALPIGLGMAGLHRFPRIAGRVRGPLLAVSTAVLLVLVLGLGASLGGSDALRLLRTSGPAVALLIACMLGVAGVAGTRLGLAPAQRRTIAIELAVQNFNLALVVALGILDEPLYLGPALVYLPVMLLFAGGLAAAVSWRGRGAAGAGLSSAAPRALPARHPGSPGEP